MQFHEKKNSTYLISRVFLPGLFLIFWPTVTPPPWWSSYWTLTSEWNYAKQAIFGEKNDASTVPPVTPLLFTFLDFMKRTRDIVQKNLTDTDQSRFRIVSQISWGITIANKRFKNANTVLWSIESNCHPVSRYR